jgi:replicative DNA helicase
MQVLALKSQPIDILTVREQLIKSRELELIGGPYLLTQLTSSVVSSANIEAHAHIIFDQWSKRTQGRLYAEFFHEAFEDCTDGFELLHRATSKLNDLAIAGTRCNEVDKSVVLVQRFKYLVEMSTRTEEVLGITSGFGSVDHYTGGWQNNDLIIFAARPSIGKTALALNFLLSAAAKQVWVLFLSLEMAVENLMDRLLSAKSGVSYEAITKARLNEEQQQDLYKNGIVPLSELPFELRYIPSLTILELRAIARRWLQKIKAEGCQKGSSPKNCLIIIDYLQLMSSVRDNYNSKTREQELSAISRGLKVLAGELNVPIIALSQMSRDIEKRPDKMPKLSDIRESGGIEQDADIVAFLGREDYEKADFEKTEADRDKATIVFKKNRNGKLGLIPMQTALDIQRWMEPDQYKLYQRNLSSLPYPPSHPKNENLF